MKPGRRIFASNAVWAGGPDAGLAVKAPYTDAELADGRYRSQVPPPRPDNFEYWAWTSRLDRIAASAVLNIDSQPVTAAGWPGAWTGGPMDGIHDPTPATPDVMTILNAEPITPNEEYVSRGGRLWVAGTALAAPTVAVAPRVAVDGAGLRVQVLGSAVAGADVPWSSLNYAAWLTWAGGCAAGTWADIDYGGVGANARWVIGDGAHGGGAGAILRSPGPATIFSGPFTDAGFAGAITCLGYSHHYAGDIYPDDPGNHMWVGLSATECSVAVDASANAWSLAAAHGLGATPVDIAYSKPNTEWIAVDLTCGISRSTDGVTWVRSAAGTATGLYASIVNATTARICTDGFGHWLVLLVDSVGNTAELHASSDDGATWFEVWPDVVLAGVTDGCCWYGLGRFYAAITDAAGAGIIYATPRAAE